MTPKEKAEELLDAMSTNYGDEHHHCTLYVAKNCAIIAIDELIKDTVDWGIRKIFDEGTSEYWQEVKKEIEKL
jgi:hypothetical protein